jgi:hypothetical protein
MRRQEKRGEEWQQQEHADRAEGTAATALCTVVCTKENESWKTRNRRYDQERFLKGSKEATGPVARSWW